ncbi:MAG: sugar transferase, partial [Armatimonadetes bacterium]|nr:sugar transferase [Armatimonadota bacterium]
MPSTNVIADLAVVEEPLSRIAPKVITYRRRKRLLDIFGSLFLIVVNAPLMLAILALIKLTSRGPVLYRSERIGLCGRSFTFYKFRSMYLDADKRLAEVIGSNEKDGPIFKMHDDPRITRIGRVLRHTSMDELPQLFNVLRG